MVPGTRFFGALMVIDATDYLKQFGGMGDWRVRGEVRELKGAKGLWKMGKLPTSLGMWLVLRMRCGGRETLSRRVVAAWLERRAANGRFS